MPNKPSESYLMKECSENKFDAFTFMLKLKAEKQRLLPLRDPGANAELTQKLIETY